jgi:hypothetical protein
MAILGVLDDHIIPPQWIKVRVNLNPKSVTLTLTLTPTQWPLEPL